MNNFDTILKKYLEIFADQEMYFVNDTKTLENFRLNPENTEADIIRMKVGLVNDRDMKLAINPEDMVRHIMRLNFDSRINSEDLALVNDIANIRGETESVLLHFASAYCNFHRPDVFPIYSAQFLEFYREYIKHYQLPLDSAKLDTYSVFCAALTDLINRLELPDKMNYLQLRKFAWLYAEKVLEEAKNKPTDYVKN
jgi:hypothetical protein